MIILGANAYHGDSSACILVDGQLVAAAEEERFTRIKHWAGLPVKAVEYCLREAGVAARDIDHIAVNRNPSSNTFRKALFMLKKRPSWRLIRDRFKNTRKVKDIKTALAEQIGVDPSRLKAELHYVEHHVAHLASAFFVSPFEKSVIVSVDGFGDFVGAMWGTGEGNELNVRGRSFFPHSLGLFYLAGTQYLGFPKYGDEYKVMGLAALGEPSRLDEMKKIVRLHRTGQFSLDLDYFIHHSEGVRMAWDGGEPEIGPVFHRKMEYVLGPRRVAGDRIEKRHENIAASLQVMYEEAFLHVLRNAYEQTGIPNLCLAGGCAMNSVANGKICDRSPFEKVYIQPAAGDAGGALGAAFYVWNRELKNPRDFVMGHAYWGPDFSQAEIRKALSEKSRDLEENGCTAMEMEDEKELCKRTAKKIADGKIVGWFQGRMEWGPRALGNRSIVADPRRAEMKDVLNARIKNREPFRPFAPSILLEKVGEYFETDRPDPFMNKVYPVRSEKRSRIPAVTHVDGTGRIQTVRKEDNPLYWQLIKEFEKRTGVPVVLNTSFNDNEPIVCTPSEALDCFLRTQMDVLVLGNRMITRN